MAMKLGPYDTVRIRNVGTLPWSDKWNNQLYRCQPNGEALVPFAGVCLWFGHPSAIDVPNDPKQRYRTEEFQRLCVKYGVYDRHEEFVPGQVFVDDRGKDKNPIPQIEVYDLEGERLTTVLEDPDGTSMAPFSQAEQETLDLRVQIAQLQRQMQTLVQQAAVQERANTSIAQSPNVSDDLPDPLPNQPQAPMPPIPSPHPDPAQAAPSASAGGHPLIPTSQGGPPVPPGFGAPIDDQGNEVGMRPDTPMPQGEPDEVSEDTPTRVRVSG